MAKELIVARDPGGKVVSPSAESIFPKRNHYQLDLNTK